MIVCTWIAQYGLHTVFHTVEIIDYLMGTDERMTFANSEKEYHIVGFHVITKIIDEKIAALQEQITNLKKERKAAVAKADEAAKQKVIDAFIASGKTAEEFLAGINAESAQ